MMRAGACVGRCKQLVGADGSIRGLEHRKRGTDCGGCEGAGVGGVGVVTRCRLPGRKWDRPWAPAHANTCACGAMRTRDGGEGERGGVGRCMERRAWRGLRRSIIGDCEAVVCLGAHHGGDGAGKRRLRSVTRDLAAARPLSWLCVVLRFAFLSGLFSASSSKKRTEADRPGGRGRGKRKGENHPSA